MCLFVVTMSQEFADDLSEEAFHGLTKDQLLEVADIFKIEVSATEKRLKHTIKSVLLPFLIEKGILSRVDMREVVRIKKSSLSFNCVPPRYSGLPRSPILQLKFRETEGEGERKTAQGKRGVVGDCVSLC